jgi:peptide/nickel transport system substrate-binding protein
MPPLAKAPFRWIACLLALAVVAGCTRVGTGGGTASGNPWTRHGLLRIVSLEEPDTLNPVVGNFQIDSDLAMLWGGFFFDWNDKNEFVPDLATELPTLENHGVSEDGKTITYHLRQGVTWQDGVPFTADDVIFTWHAVMNKKNNVPSTVGYDLITAIDEPDSHTIVVHLRSAWAPFVATFFSQSSNPFPLLPKHLLAKYDDINRVAFNSQPVGTGPFIIDRWQRGSKITFHANPHYWRGPPKLKEIWYTPIPSDSTIVTLFQSHEADLDFYSSVRDYKELSQIPGTRLVLTPFTQYGLYALNLKSPALQAVDVRRALWYGLDSKRILADVTHGVYSPARTDQPSFLWAYNPNAAHYPYDPAKARALLDGAGWKLGPDGVRSKNGVRMQLVIADSSGDSTGAALDLIAQRDWRDIGIDASIKTYVTSLYFASYGAGGIVQSGKFDVAGFSWANGVDPDDSTQLMCDQMPPNGQNVSHFCNAELDEQERIALSSNDRAVRKRAYDRIQAIAADQVPAILNWYVDRISIENTDLKNYRPAHAVTSFWNPWEWDI